MSDDRLFEQYERKRYGNRFKHKVSGIKTLSDDQLKEFWDEALANKPFYHGTNSKAFELMKEEKAINPNARYWGNEFVELEMLLKKAGNEYFGGGRTRGQIYLTAILPIGKNYASRSPESWSLFVGEKNWYNKNFEGAEKQLHYALAYGFFVINRFTNERAGEIIESNPSINTLASHSLLEKSEIIRAKELFNKYWEYFISPEPKLLVFKTGFSNDPVMEYFNDVNKFVSLVKENDDFLVQGGIDRLLNFEEMIIETPISLDYLTESITVPRQRE